MCLSLLESYYVIHKRTIMGKGSFYKALLTFLLMAGCSALLAQGVVITGVVTDGEFATPLPGVNIEVKGKGTGTLTDENGSFSITAEPADVLVFSFIGYATVEIAVNDKQVINLALFPEATKLGEVVVVGYGTQSRANVTSAISKLDKEVLKSAPRSNVGSALQGSISGLRVVNNSGAPGAAPTILLRGGGFHQQSWVAAGGCRRDHPLVQRHFARRYRVDRIA
jgi:hypothetical protein